MILRHAELLDEKGGLFTAPLRGAKAADQYICRGGSCHIDYAPEFTYHGFRYAELTVDGEWEGDISVAALQFYTDLDTDAFFRCGSALANEIYRAAVRTERCNLHTIASDCPQRDERMGWMNDAVVRFMAMPYMFNIPKFFEKIAADIANEQDELGRITCTAPFIFGERPADPVCAAYFIAVEEHFRATGSADLIAAHYDRLARWSEYLKSREKDGIVSYSYYGDWAGPEDACSVVKTIGDGGTEVLEGYEPGAAHSRYLPGEMISTAVHYMQYRLLERFAERLRKTEDAARFGREAERVRAAFLKKWVSGGRVYQGAQGCQALALFLDILPERDRAEAAEILAGSVRRSGRLQTGNITTPMLFDVLIGYGYTDLAWELFTRREYPSLGYMIENGATTIWERYELKKDEGMNSHNHPMHGASAAFLCRSLAGFAIAEPAKKYGLRPKLPKELPYYEILFPLLCGGLYLKYERKFGNEYIMVNAPFGTEIELELDGAKYTLRAGLHRAKKESDNWIFI